MRIDRSMRVCDNRARLPRVTLPFTVMYRVFTASRLGLV